SSIQFLINVEQEILFEVPQEELDWVLNWLPNELKTVVILNHPLSILYGYGKSWFMAYKGHRLEEETIFFSKNERIEKNDQIQIDLEKEIPQGETIW
ncbi:MAG: hypothetical protein AABZ60_02260, partial [Planctomycetota bacterium]